MRISQNLYTRLFATAAIALFGFAGVAKASITTITVQNASFEQLQINGVNAAGQSNQLNDYTNSSKTQLETLAGWTSATYTSAGTGTVASYNFVFKSVADATGTGAYGTQYGDLKLWGNNGITASPDGGNFLAMDGAFESGALSQTLTGLTVGMDTKVSFYYAGAQQYGFTGATTEGFKVSLTDGTANTTESHLTGILDNDSHGFTGWHLATIDFTPTNTTETLSFLAQGTPAGVPPFSLLDGISVVQVTPEPSTLALMGTGVLSMAGLIRRRFKASAQ